ncbi:hypothetical protein DV736_g5866, partial [Chaetothyriales sp. CBS 134916]
MAENAEAENISSLIAQLQKTDLSSQDLSKLLPSGPLKFAIPLAQFLTANTHFPFAKTHRITVRIVRILAAHRVFIEIAGPQTKFGPTALSDFFTVPMLNNGIKHCVDLGYRSGAGFPAYAKETKYRGLEDELDCPFQYAFRTKLHCFDWWEEHPREAAQFNSMMTGYGANRPPSTSMFPVEKSVGKGVDGQQKVLIVEVGGGLGHDLMLFWDSLPDTQGRLVLQDQPEAIDTTPKGNLHPTIEVMKHDFFQPQRIKGARTYIFKHMLHDWPDHKALTVLRNIKAVMEDGSKLIIIENVLPEVGPLPIATAGLDFILMIGFAAMERTEKQWEALLAEMGLKITDRWVKEDGDGVPEAMLA